MKSSDKLKDLLNLETFVSGEEARELALAGKLKHTTTVKGDLDLYSTKIKSLPEDLKVGGDLSLEGTKIKSLPEGLVVGGSLNLHGTKITSLPNDLKVKGTVYGSNNKMKVPEGIKYESQ